jgi:hypothetical protein
LPRSTGMLFRHATGGGVRKVSRPSPSGAQFPMAPGRLYRCPFCRSAPTSRQRPP